MGCACDSCLVFRKLIKGFVGVSVRTHDQCEIGKDLTEADFGTPASDSAIAEQNIEVLIWDTNQRRLVFWKNVSSHALLTIEASDLPVIKMDLTVPDIGTTTTARAYE